MTVSKISLSGLTFSVYVNFLWNKYNSLPAQTSSYRRLLAHLTLLPLPIAYALMSYNLQFALSIMWLDGVILLPLLLLGVEKLLDKQRNLWFILPLTAIFYFNYYISYMAGIFCALYLLFRLLTTYSHSRHDLWRILKNFRSFYINILGTGSSFADPDFFPICLSENCRILWPVLFMILDWSTSRYSIYWDNFAMAPSTTLESPDFPIFIAGISLFFCPFFSYFANGSLSGKGLAPFYWQASCFLVFIFGRWISFGHGFYNT